MYRSPYPSSDFNCVSKYLRYARPDLEDIRYVFVQDTYHGYIEGNGRSKKGSKRQIIKPDVVSALNCGFIFYSSWDDSIPSLLKFPEVPLVFSEYYEEDSKLNLQKIDSLGKLLVKPQIN